MFGPDVDGVGDDRASCGSWWTASASSRRMRAHPVDKDAVGRGDRAAAAAVHAQRRGAPGAAGRHRARARSTWRSRSRAPGCRRERLDDLVGRRLRARGRGRSAARRRRRRRIRPHARLVPKRKICVVVTARPSYSRIRTALQAIQQHPDLELQLVVAASALLDRYGNADSGHRARRVPDRRARLHGGRGREPGHIRQVHRPRAGGAGDGVRQPEAGRGGDDRRSLRDAGHRGRRVVHEHPGRARAGRRGHRIDRREGAARGDQAGEPAPGLDAGRAPSASAGWARSPSTVVVTGCPSIDIAAEVAAQPGARLRSVREVRRRRPDAPICRRAISS